MKTISPSTFQFLKGLAKHNDRDWFNAHKPHYEEVKAAFAEFIDALILRIATFDNSIAHHRANDCIFRIHRDVRFSKDKSPYKTHVGAHITSAPRKSEIHTRAGYYIHIGPGESMLAGGAYLPESGWLRRIRQEISYNGQALKNVLHSKSFRKYFHEIEGEKLKTIPRDYPADHPDIELLKHKSFLAVHKCTDQQVLSPRFLAHCENVFRALHPFDNFLNSVLD